MRKLLAIKVPAEQRLDRFGMTLKPAHADSNAGGDRSGERRAEEHTCRPREPDRTISTIQRPTHERAVELSHHFEGATINLDIGGGTTKRALIRDGTIEDAAAINVGARLIVIAGDGTVTRAEPVARLTVTAVVKSE